MKKIPLAALSPDEINILLDIVPVFRGKQIFNWVQKGIKNFNDMSNLPNSLRKKLAEQAVLITSGPVSIYREEGVSYKVRIKLDDGYDIESVLLIDDAGRKTACLSSQVGCSMGCGFCKTAGMGFKRNLFSHEIVEQVHILESEFGNISHIVFMGMGEPLLNPEEVKKAISILHHPEGKNISLRKITISSCGITHSIKDLALNGPHVRLAVSLVTADEITRKKLMPVTHSHSLKKIKEALILFQEKTKKWITYEIVLIKDVTDRKEDVDALIAFIPPVRASVNLIPWNPAPGLDFKRPDKNRIRWFKDSLTDAGIVVTQRYQKGNSIHAACGQLFVE